MNKKDLQALLTQTEDALSKLTVVDAHLTENLQAQRDDSLARIAKAEEILSTYEQQKATLVVSHKLEVDTLNTHIADLQGQLDALGGTDLAQKMKQENEIKQAQRVIENAQRELDRLKGKDTPKHEG